MPGIFARMGNLVLFLFCAAVIFAFGEWLIRRWFGSETEHPSPPSLTATASKDRTPPSSDHDEPRPRA